MKIVFYGLTITSSWGNGHATTYRALIQALAAQGHVIDFVEKDVDWYRNNRDLPEPPFCQVHFYKDWNEHGRALINLSSDADAVVIGSYFPDAKRATLELLSAGFGPLLFYDIDTPITLAQLRSGTDPDYLNRQMLPHYAAYLSFTGGPALQQLEHDFGVQRAVPFYCSVNPDTYRPIPAREQYRCALSYLGTYAADRQPKLMQLLNGTAALLPNAGFLVAGPQYPQEVQWQPNVRRMIHVHPPDHPAFYSSSRFTLNLTRHDMVVAGFSPSVRLFEASACGAAILSDDWSGLQEFLTPGSEILLPADEYEVADILTNLGEQERMMLGCRARERILAHHTATHRAQQFEQVVEACHQPADSSSSSSSEFTQQSGLVEASSSKL